MTESAPKLLGESTVDFRDPNKGDAVREMFAGIAAKYDRINRIMTFNRDRAWRRIAVKMSGVERGQTVLDVCCGTGDLAFEFAKVVGSGGRVVGTDFTPEMLVIARQKAAGIPVDRETGKRLEVPFQQADTLALPFPDASFDCCSVGWGIRNVQNIAAGLREMARVVRPGGTVVILECTQPKWKFFAAINRWYMNRVVPWIGQKLSGSKQKAYSYLPDSVALFPGAPKLAAMMEEAGMRDVRYRYLMMGSVAVHVGVKG
jgi:demethylmenaquinone methyltransferase/2-methoxy-6-polyprenyl-1,4-benzoquinol methylase